MIDLKITERILHYKRKWFYKKPASLDILRFTEYYIVPHSETIFGYKREDAFTRIINLSKTPEELLAQCGGNTQYKIKRAEREGIRFAIEDNLEAFIDFYNSFVKSKDVPAILHPLEKDYIYSLKNNLIITKAIFENEILAMHSYIMDKDIKRARLLNSASLFRYEDDSQKRNLIGRANRFLHYQDMLYFKKQGFELYDMGGYAYNTNNAMLQKLNDFKDGFGGEIVEESIYISLPLYILRTIKAVFKKVLIFTILARKTCDEKGHE